MKLLSNYRNWFLFWIRFLFPGGVLFVAGVWGISRIPAAVIPQGTFVTLFSLVAATALLLAWRFHRDSVFFSVLVITGAWLGMGGILSFYSESTLYHIPELFSSLVTVNIVLFFLFQDRGLFSVYGLVRFLFVAIQAVGVILLFQSGDQGVIGKWVLRLVHPVPVMGHVSFIFVSIGLAILFVKFLKVRSPLSAGGFWSLTASFYMITKTHSRFTLTFWSLLTVGILVMAIVEQSFQLAYRDELTGLPGRRALNEALNAVSGTLTVLMVDIDYFKRFNDRYGHDVGDQVLKLVASRLANVRGGRAYRYGGEEFVVLFPGKKEETVLPKAEKLREAVRQAEFVLRRSWKRKKGNPKRRKKADRSGKRLSVTVSIGIAETKKGSFSPGNIIKAADKALYRAKRGGRNRVSK